MKEDLKNIMIYSRRSDLIYKVSRQSNIICLGREQGKNKDEKIVDYALLTSYGYFKRPVLWVSYPIFKELCDIQEVSLDELPYNHLLRDVCYGKEKQIYLSVSDDIYKYFNFFLLMNENKCYEGGKYDTRDS